MKICDENGNGVQKHMFSEKMYQSSRVCKKGKKIITNVPLFEANSV